MPLWPAWMWDLGLGGTALQPTHIHSHPGTEGLQVSQPNPLEAGLKACLQARQ